MPLAHMRMCLEWAPAIGRVVVMAVDLVRLGPGPGPGPGLVMGSGSVPDPGAVVDRFAD